MAIGSLLMMIALGIAGLLINSAQNDKKYKQQQQMIELVQSLSFRMNDPIDCTALLGETNLFNPTLASATETVEGPIEIKTVFGNEINTPANYIKSGKIFPSGFSLRSVGGPGVTIHAIEPEPGIGDLIVKRTTSAVPPYSSPLKANFPINNDSSKIFTYAYPQSPATPPPFGPPPLAPQPATSTADDAILTKYKAVIKFYPSEATWNPNQGQYQITLWIKVQHSTGKIWACHGANSEAEACEIAARGTYNPHMPAGYDDYRCNPDLQCFDEKNPAPNPIFPLSAGIFAFNYGPSDCPPTTDLTYYTCPHPTLYKPYFFGKVNTTCMYYCKWCSLYRYP